MNEGIMCFYIGVSLAFAAVAAMLAAWIAYGIGKENGYMEREEQDADHYHIQRSA